MRRVVTSLFCLALLGACSSKSLYNFNRSLGEGKADCEALTSADERVQCEAAFNKDYETYKKQREQL